MKSKITLLAVFLTATACGKGQSASNLQDRGDHFQANHCEIFVDKISPSNGSHAARYLTFYLKTLNDRLDGPIEEVGMWRSESRTGDGGLSGWQAQRAGGFFGAQDYWQLTLTTSGDYIGYVTTTGAFYVRTTKGTTYWAKARGESDFVVNLSLFNRVEDIAGHYNYGPRLSFAAETRGNSLSNLNPQGCY